MATWEPTEKLREKVSLSSRRRCPAIGATSSCYHDREGGGGQEDGTPIGSS